MPTLAELKKEASELRLSGFSRMKKPELEKLIYNERRRREELALQAIRQAPAPDAEKIQLDNLGFAEPLEIDSLEVDDSLIQAVKGKGISNAARIANYVRQTPGRKRLTPAMARRARKKYNAGDFTVSLPALFHGVNILPYL